MNDCRSGGTVSKFMCQTIPRCCEELCEHDLQATPFETSVFNVKDCCTSSCSKKYPSLCATYRDTRSVIKESKVPNKPGKLSDYLLSTLSLNLATTLVAYKTSTARVRTQKNVITTSVASKILAPQTQKITPTSDTFLVTTRSTDDFDTSEDVFFKILYLVIPLIVVFCCIIALWLYYRKMLLSNSSAVKNVKNEDKGKSRQRAHQRLHLIPIALSTYFTKSTTTEGSNAKGDNKEKRLLRRWSYLPRKKSFKYFYKQTDQTVANPNDKIQGILPAFNDNQWPLNELSINNILPGHIVGSGHFGIIRKGVYYREGLLGPGIDVALKTIQGAMNDNDGIVNLETQKIMKYSLELELKALQRVGTHPNVIQLVGAVTQPSLIVVTEFCEFGDLQKYLAKRKLHNMVFMGTIAKENELNAVVYQHFVTMSALQMYAFQIANGADFLSQKTLVHRDLALRNILLTEQHVVKISDFGLVVKGDGYQSKHRQELPIRWLPPESIKQESGTFTPASDVWSFGVVLWELFTIGKNPCHEVQAPLRRKGFREWLLRGHRYPQPEFADEQM